MVERDEIAIGLGTRPHRHCRWRQPSCPFASWTTTAPQPDTETTAEICRFLRNPLLQTTCRTWSSGLTDAGNSK